MKINERIKELKNKYYGKRIYIIGNGPSLKEINMHYLKNEYTFSYNRAYIAYDDWGFVPKFYSIVDRIVLPDNKDEVNQMIKSKKFSKTLFFFPDWSNIFISKGENVFFIKEFPYMFFQENIDDIGFSILGNVAATSIQIVVYMGFKEIVLLGIDANYTEKPDKVKENKELTKKIGWTVYESTEDSDPNHFLPNYFGKGKRYSIPQAHLHRYGWRRVKDWIKVYNRLNPSHKIKIVNTSLNSKLKIFPKINFEEVINNKELNIKDMVKKTIVIWGTGEAARNFLTKEFSNYEIKYFVDNNPKRQGNEFYGKPIYSPNILRNDYDFDFLVIAVKSGMKILKEQLESLKVIERAVDYLEL